MYSYQPTIRSASVKMYSYMYRFIMIFRCCRWAHCYTVRHAGYLTITHSNTQITSILCVINENKNLLITLNTFHTHIHYQHMCTNRRQERKVYPTEVIMYSSSSWSRFRIITGLWSKRGGSMFSLAVVVVVFTAKFCAFSTLSIMLSASFCAAALLESSSSARCDARCWSL